MPIKGAFGGNSSRSFRAILKVFSSFSDNFNRADDFSGTLGLSSSGSFWTILRGKWNIFSNNASPFLWNNYSIMGVEMKSPNVTVSTSIREYSSNIGANGEVYSVGAGNGTTGESGYFWATLNGINTTVGLQIGDWIQATSGTGRVYGGTPELVEITSIVNINTITFRVKTGSLGVPPSPGSVSNILHLPNQRGGTAIAVWTTDSDNWIGVVNGVGQNTSCNCSLCGNGTYSCTGYGSSSSCSSTSGSCSYFCNRWGSYTTANFGRAVTGFWRVFSYTRTEFCNGYGSSCSYTCVGWSSSIFCSSTVENVGSCNCQTCYPSYISVIQSVAGAVSELTRYSLSAAVKAIKVVTNATTKTLNIKPYLEKEMTNQIGSDLSYNNNSLTTTNKFGIVLAISDQKQGTSFDDFKIDTN
jgi:hypothetical protein